MNATSPLSATEKLEQLSINHPVFRQYHLDVQELIDAEHPDMLSPCPEDPCSYSDMAHQLYHQVLVATRRTNRNNSPRAQRAAQLRIANRDDTPFDRVVAVMGRQEAEDLVRWARYGG